MDDLLDELYYKGLRRFSAARIAAEEDLFAVRAALVYTPTSRIPPTWIGSGPLDVWVPLAIPTIQEFLDCRSRQSVRLWVDLLQRATGKLRWRPNLPARVQIVRFDSVQYSEHNLCVKSLLDALKASTTGRRDRRLLYYFGAIRDDNNSDLADFSLKQELVDSPAKAGTRIVVQAVPPRGQLTTQSSGRASPAAHRERSPHSRGVQRTARSEGSALPWSSGGRSTVVPSVEGTMKKLLLLSSFIMLTSCGTVSGPIVIRSGSLVSSGQPHTQTHLYPWVTEPDAGVWKQRGMHTVPLYVVVESEPPGAIITVNDETRGTTPAELTIPFKGLVFNRATYDAQANRLVVEGYTDYEANNYVVKVTSRGYTSQERVVKGLIQRLPADQPTTLGQFGTFPVGRPGPLVPDKKTIKFILQKSGE